MIRLTRFDKTYLYVNADLVESVEPTPDTVVTLIDGKRFLVRETVEDVVGAVTAFKAAVGALAELARDQYAPLTHPAAVPTASDTASTTGKD